ncbi:UDP-N-acetylmuramoyl-tripeptide--D-alanyl-D-alanine ligase [Methylotenera sp.]|uniref:UDP-N-acetylmuramoyl-tripeptide--D-alanyl-D- alanine ligase n=2 Tax=Methylotenera sp. TaxID=2051956 RepID=UPI00271E181B|nr:UDP-N-acetylmuramoyl-tripeptide--D-alanyl-D-alanine ligase [Methylotenera sp.]MDO9206400.1 UDP-N-acetylmuramoyl-tripeptide--D-alanyl-D-alanine ligase [Methylotenera sp.]MDP1521813.1 UDP-N-acetylmuramoyl-tripeptide--D-alanyl-D-alanine ligase [Methylotenera sp.]MDP2070727.1 UDP-N-acetylmuramoyl-tripeptide--D-alanyl-D-alanine ligase [Methylotenera sp.]MDP3004792.1 UDP-N-acetylmuramoyl-tripeptide--D-alanyl-D-alanine ligase [Methylotenera sp.]MDP3307315.1 UDP-N-acetylmuramoyl-tripeptide--D-alany
MMLLSEAANAIQAKLYGQDAMFTNVGTDSRNVTKGQLFVALKGENFDGHDFAAKAIEQGAAAVLVSSPTLGVEPAILVEDTYQALGALAAYWRSRFAIPFVAVTGSNGKTTVKEMIAAILAEKTGSHEVIHATVGNLNNHIGLPLTLLKLRAIHQFSVLEMGMSHLGEIEYLTRIAKPNVAVVNNAGTAHIGEMGSRENIAKAKGEIFAGLSDDGVAVINADDEYASYWKSLNSGKKIVTFGLNVIGLNAGSLNASGLNKPADVSATYEEMDALSQVHLTTPQGRISFKLDVLGAHNISNALAASAVAVALGISNADIARGLSSFSGVKGRLQRKPGLNGAVLIDDTYNANPDSMKAAIDVLAHQAGEKILILGDMGELGADAKRMHAEIGTYAKNAGLRSLHCLGALSVEMARGFGAGANHYASPEDVAKVIKPLLSQDATVLVKGSRFMKMERVVDLLEEKLNETAVMQKKLMENK